MLRWLLVDEQEQNILDLDNPMTRRECELYRKLASQRIYSTEIAIQKLTNRIDERFDKIEVQFSDALHRQRGERWILIVSMLGVIATLIGVIVGRYIDLGGAV